MHNSRHNGKSTEGHSINGNYIIEEKLQRSFNSKLEENFRIRLEKCKHDDYNEKVMSEKCLYYSQMRS